jgi:hypothetical protein
VKIKSRGQLLLFIFSLIIGIISKSKEGGGKVKEFVKKIAVAGSGLALLAGTAFASVGNSGTGENSLNRVSFDGRNRTEVETDNHANVRNDLDVNASSGFNAVLGLEDHHRECDGDECGGGRAGDLSVATGDADASADVTNRVNRSTVDVTAPNMDLGDIGNMDTGRNSENCVNATQSNRLEVETNNYATVNNDVDVNANTGFNMILASGRGDASISTGNASATASIVNEVNTNTISVR